MNIFQDKILVMAKPEVTSIISDSTADISGLQIIEADSENRAFELICNHFFVLVIIDETIASIDMYKIGAMLLSHKKTHNAPLLIITDHIQPKNFLADFKALQIDYIIKPFDTQLILAKVKIFFELFKQKNAVAQSIDELDKVYKKIVAQHELVMKEEFSKKELVNITAVAANQIQQPLQSLKGYVYLSLRNQNISPEIKSNLTAVKAAAETISQISKKLFAFPGKARKIVSEDTSNMNDDQAYQILYIENSDEDFSIFNHFMKSVIKCELAQAKTLEQGMKLISRNTYDLIFMDYLLPDGTGFDILSRLKQMRSDIPMIFTLNKPDSHLGPETIAKGALTYFIKEEISGTNMLSIIYNTLQKAKITREVEDARNRIVMISRKDYLTRLFNRRCFEQELDAEISKAERYKIPLSILILDFDQFESINNTHGYDTGDAVLITSASLIQSMVRTNDVVCRYGGEEFGIVLPNTAINGARILAQRIRKKMADHKFEKNSIALNITVSIGIASYTHETDTAFSSLVKKALKALSSAMDRGGNRIEIFIN